VGRNVYPRYRCRGRFCGRRVNCERVPQLPALAVREVLDDPRKIPYLFVWKNDDGEVQEAVRIISLGPPPYLPSADSIEIKRTDGSVVRIRAIKSSLLRNGGYATLLACPCCCSLRRGLYGWEPGGKYTSSAQTCGWLCRRCAGLRYASEGGALVHRGRGAIARLFELYAGPLRSDRPEPWYPYVFSSPADAAAAGFCKLNEAH
jgi:hypothetical protein